MSSSTPKFTSQIGAHPFPNTPGLNSLSSTSQEQGNKNASTDEYDTSHSLPTLSTSFSSRIHDNKVKIYSSLITQFDLLDSRAQTVLNNLTLIKSKLILDRHSPLSTFNQNPPTITLVETTLKAIKQDFETLTQQYQSWKDQYPESSDHYSVTLHKKYHTAKQSVQNTEKSLGESKLMINQQLSTMSMAGNKSEPHQFPPNHGSLAQPVLTPSSLSLQPSLAQQQRDTPHTPAHPNVTVPTDLVLQRLSGVDLVLGGGSATPLPAQTGLSSTPSHHIPGHQQPHHHTAGMDTASSTRSIPLPPSSTTASATTSTRDPRGITDIGKLELMAMKNTNHFTVPPQTTRHFDLSSPMSQSTVPNHYHPTSTRSMVEGSRLPRGGSSQSGGLRGEDREDGLDSGYDDESVLGGEGGGCAIRGAGLTHRRAAAVAAGGGYDDDENTPHHGIKHTSSSSSSSYEGFASDYYPIKANRTWKDTIVELRRRLTTYCIRSLVVLLLIGVGYGIYYAVMTYTPYSLSIPFTFFNSLSSSAATDDALSMDAANPGWLGRLSPFATSIDVRPVDVPGINQPIQDDLAVYGYGDPAPHLAYGSVNHANHQQGPSHGGGYYHPRHSPTPGEYTEDESFDDVSDVGDNIIVSTSSQRHPSAKPQSMPQPLQKKAPVDASGSNTSPGPAATAPPAEPTPSTPQQSSTPTPTPTTTAPATEEATANADKPVLPPTEATTEPPTPNDPSPATQAQAVPTPADPAPTAVAIDATDGVPPTVANISDADSDDDPYSELISDDSSNEPVMVEIPLSSQAAAAVAARPPNQAGYAAYHQANQHYNHHQQQHAYYTHQQQKHALQQRQAQQYLDSVRNHQEALARQQQQYQQQQQQAYYNSQQAHQRQQPQYNHYVNPQPARAASQPPQPQLYPQQPSRYNYVQPAQRYASVQPPVYQYRYKTEL